tara:strand:- start:418 stop:1098 length:681 start_codon:yes stop_codon:yes gene_type:complete
MKYVKFLLQQLRIVGLVIVGAFIFLPIIFPNRRKIWAMRLLPPKDRKWYWYLCDSTSSGFGSDENNYLNSTYGVYEFVKKRGWNGKWEADYETFNALSPFRKKVLAWRWTVARNGAWNYIVSKVPDQIQGDDYNCLAFETTSEDHNDNCTIWRDAKTPGMQSCDWPAENPKFFRYSFSKKASWYNLHRFFAYVISGGKWYTHFYFMIGHSHNRHLVKLGSFNPQEN